MNPTHGKTGALGSGAHASLTDAEIAEAHEKVTARGECAGPLTTWPSPGIAHVTIVCRDNWVHVIEWLAMCERFIPRLLATIDARDAEIRALRAEVEALTRHNRELWDERKAAEAAAGETAQALVESRAEVERLTAERDAARRQVEHWQTRARAEWESGNG